MESHIFINPPPADFGKEAMEKQKRAKKTKMNIIKITLLITALSGILVLLANKTDALSFLSDKKNKSEKKGNGKSNAQESATTGITVTKKWDMPKELLEISGLSHIEGNRFACVQDELGSIFIYNTSSSSVEKEIPFAAAGDYEGIAAVGESIWVLRADGKLFEVSDLNAAKPLVKEYATHLTLKQDSEGLCYDKKNNRLLVAIKGSEPGKENYKGVYAFDIASKKMDQAPVYKIDLLDEVFSPGKKKKEPINPSGIAIHPGTDDIYITDGRNPQLLVIDAKGSIKKLYQLNTKEFPQPEGIIFNSTGDLFISNEGTTEPGNISQVKIIE